MFRVSSFARINKVLLNKNVQWLSAKGAWLAYIAMIVGFRGFLSLLHFDSVAAWTATNVTHAVVTFYLWHYIKGSPFDDFQGKFDKLTFWEQIDSGRELTRTKKFLTIVPVILAGFAVQSTLANKATWSLVLNIFVGIIISFFKMPAFNQRRLQRHHDKEYQTGAD